MYLLLFTFFLSTLNRWVPHVIGMVLTNIYSQTKGERELGEEEFRLQGVLSSLSMVDEFAKYARTQRKLNKIQQELKSVVSERQSALMKKYFILSYSFRALVTLLVLFTVWKNKYEPVIILPAQWLKPLESIISWPTGVPGGVSIMIWMSIMDTTIRIMTTNLKRFVT